MTTAELEAFVARHRAELHAHCYRMLGSVADADDALQDALLGAWRGLAGFEGRSSLRTWLYRIATNACLQLIARRRPRILPVDACPAATDTRVDAPVFEPVWLEPYPADPHARLEELEHVELAFVAALQHLPATQRAVLILDEVLGCSAAEIAEMLETTVASVTSALQRARATLRRGPSQQATLRELGDARQRELVAAFVDAWARGDATALIALLARDVRFTMPPLPTWFDGRDAVGRFFAERVFATPWRLVPMRASGQLAFACYQGPAYRLSALQVVTLAPDGGIAELTGFLDPSVHARFSVPDR